MAGPVLPSQSQCIEKQPSTRPGERTRRSRRVSALPGGDRILDFGLAISAGPSRPAIAGHVPRKSSIKNRKSETALTFGGPAEGRIAPLNRSLHLPGSGFRRVRHLENALAKTRRQSFPLPCPLGASRSVPAVAFRLAFFSFTSSLCPTRIVHWLPHWLLHFFGSNPGISARRSFPFPTSIQSKRRAIHT